MWYLSGEHLKSELDNKCLDAHTGNGSFLGEQEFRELEDECL